jgi:RNA polymerase sigma-70 factor (ECF subfamily)
MLRRMGLDEQVAAHLARGAVDEAATAALEGLGPAVLGYLASLHPEDEAHDVFSVFAEDLWRGLPGFRRECSLRSWAFRLAWHASARHRRDPWRRRGERFPTSAASRLAASIAGSRLPGGRRDALRQLREALDPEERTLLVLRVDQELEWDEVAAVLSADGAPVEAATLRKRFERIKDRLARLARAQGLLE